MKKILQIFILSILIIINIWIVDAKIDWLDSINWANTLSDTSIQIVDKGSISDNVKSIAFSIYEQAKLIFSWILLIFIVYSWAQMIMSMWTDEESLSSSKRNLWYALIWLLFVNIPWTIYNSFIHSNNAVWGWAGNWDSNPNSSIFINVEDFRATLNESIIWFIEIMLVSIWILVIILAWIKMITSTWDESKVTEAKQKIIWTIIGLIFVWFIEAWQAFAYSWEIEDGKDIFETVANLALFLAWPIAIFFLTLAWYYYITSAWDDEKITKAKTIIVNTVIGTVLILCSYLFLNDISSLLT